MIKQRRNSMLTSINKTNQPFANQNVSTIETKKNNENLVESVKSEQPVEEKKIQYDKYGHTYLGGINLGRSLLADKFSEEDVVRWNDIAEKQGPLLTVFDRICFPPSSNLPSGTMSMNFFDFMYLVEKGDVVNPQQALSATDAKQQVENGNWSTFFKHTTVYGKNINAAEYMKSIPMIQRIYEMGLVKPNGGLMTSDDITSLLQQKKYEEQKIRLDRAHIYQVEKPVMEMNTSEKMKQGYRNSI